MRLSIALSVAALVLLVILAQAIALLVVFEEREEEFIDDVLEQQIAHSMTLWQQSPLAAAPNTPDMRLFHVPAGAEPAATIPPWLAALPVGNHEVYPEGREHHVAVRANAAGRFILAYDVEEHEARLRMQTLTILSGALLIAAVTLAAVYLFAGRLTRRLEALAARVGRPGGDPFEQPGLERELIVVARALDAFEARAAEQLARERDFSANLSHELRTPLAGIRSDAELIASLPGQPDAATRRARRIIARVDRITALAGSLIALARSEPGGTEQPVALAAALDEAWEALAAGSGALPGGGGAVRLETAIAPEARVRTDPALLGLVLNNLLDNALRHTPAGVIHCALDGRVLTVRDGGPGFSPATLPRVFDRFYHAGEAGRSGIGLALVRHAADASGWSVSAGNAAEGGGEVRLDFGAAFESAV